MEVRSLKSAGSEKNGVPPRASRWLWLLLVPTFGCATAEQVQKPVATAESAARSPAKATQLVPFHGQDGFTVLMPFRPYQTERTENTPGGPVHVHLAEVRDEMAKYLVSASDFPTGSLDRVPRKNLLDSLQQSTIQSMHGTVVTSQEIDVAGMPGREFTATDPEGSEVTARIFVGNSRVYTLAGTYPQGIVPAPIRQFLDSFQPAAPKTVGSNTSGAGNEGR
jgi:hypothetical protein